MKSLKGEPDNGHVILKTTISKVIITWMSCLENDDYNDTSIKVRICTITILMLTCYSYGVCYICYWPDLQRDAYLFGWEAEKIW